MFSPSEDCHWMEQQPGSTVILEDIRPEGFEEMAKYVYGVPTDLTPMNVLATKVAADKYQMLELVQG